MRPVLLTLGLLLALGAASWLEPTAGASLQTSVYYVDAVHGSDETGDGGPTNPWQTITHALSQVDGPDVEIHVAPGVYNRALGESFPLTMEPGVSLLGAGYETTVLFGKQTKSVVFFPEAAFTEATFISGFKITHGERGVEIKSRTRASTKPTIRGNWITGNTDAGIRGYVGYSDRNHAVIRDNLISNNGNYGIYSYVDKYGRSNLRVENNRIQDNQGWGVWYDTPGYPVSTYPRFSNNVVSNNAVGGVRLGPGAQPTFVNDTVAYNQTYGIRDGQPTITNCIVWGHDDDLNAFVGYVRFSDVGDDEYAGVNGNLSLDPQFVDPARRDYHVLPTSPVVDAGDSGHSQVPLADIDGDPRILGAEVDMGADETAAYRVALTKSVTPTGVVRLGDRLTYTLVLTNLGMSSVSSVSVTDTLPISTTWTGEVWASSGRVGVSGGVLTWTGPLPLAYFGTITYRTTVDLGSPPGAIITNTATVVDCADGITETDPVTVTVGDTVILTPSRQVVDKPFAQPGQSLLYTLTISNIGNVPATGVTVDAILDSHVTFDWASSGGTFQDHAVTWPDLVVPNASSVTLNLGASIKVPLTDTTSIVNRARIIETGQPPWYLPTDQATTLIYNPVQAGFVATPTFGPVPLEVTFEDESQHATDYLWSYGDGNHSEVTTTHAYVYQDGGVYTVTLRAANPTGSDTFTRTGYITTYHYVVADFIGWPTAGIEPLAVEFINDSQYADEYLWDYGDGYTSTVTATAHGHVYTAPGAYTVTLTAIAPYDRDTLSRTAYVVVYDPVADLTVCMPGPPVCGYDNLQDAVDAAGPGDLIKVAGGVYTHTWGRPAPFGYPGSTIITQAAYISQSIAVRGGYTTTDDFADPPEPQVNLTTFDAEGRGRVLVLAGRASPYVEGLRLTGGQAFGSNALGNGVYLVTATATLDTNDIVDNNIGWGVGLYALNATAIISNGRIANHWGAGLVLDHSRGVLSGNVISNNVGGLHLDYSRAFVSDNAICHNNNWSWDGGGGLYLNYSTATLDNNVISDNSADYYGGGLYATRSIVVLNANTVSTNTTNYTGGGLYFDRSDVSLNENLISDNTSWDMGGGGLRVYRGSAILNGNLFVKNTCYSEGGGLMVSDAALEINNDVIVSNTAWYGGGGLALFDVDGTIAGSTISSNTAGWGGGLFVVGGDATLTGNRIEANQAVWYAGGGLALGRGNTTLDANVVSSNTAVYGGGLALERSDARLTNNVVADNRADSSGNGLYIAGSSPRFWHTTVARNNGGDESGIYVTGYDGRYSTVWLTNTILVSHSVAISVDAGCSVTLDSTLWGSETDWWDWGGNISRTRDFWGDPAFVDPDAHDYHITLDSAALGRGVATNLPYDIDGDSRLADSTPDLGADEFPISLWVTKRANLSTVMSGERLTYSLRLTNTGSVTLTASITDLLPGPVSPSYNIVWLDVNLKPGQVWDREVAVAVEPGYSGTLTNVLQVATEQRIGRVYTETSRVWLSPPDAPRLLAPLDGAFSASTVVTLSWVSGAPFPVEGYNLSLDGVVVTTTDTSLVVVLPLGEHTWSARAFNAGGYSAWAGPWSFEIAGTLPCVPLTGVDLNLLTPGTLYLGDAAQFGADLAPDDLTTPYTYTVSVDGQTVVQPTARDTNPLVFGHTFPASGTYTVEVAVWNCDLGQTGAVTDAVVAELVQPGGYRAYLPVVVKEN